MHLDSHIAPQRNLGFIKLNPLRIDGTYEFGRFELVKRYEQLERPSVSLARWRKCLRNPKIPVSPQRPRSRDSNSPRKEAGFRRILEVSTLTAGHQVLNVTVEPAQPSVLLGSFHGSDDFPNSVKARFIFGT